MQYGSEEYRSELTPSQMESAQFVLPYLAKAIQGAENNKRNMGVLSVPTANAGEASDVLNNSVINNFSRWVQAQQGTLPAWDMPRGASGQDRFVDFMQKRWAPIGASNDPKNLNKNWAPNVRALLEKMLGSQEYERWKKWKVAANKGGPYGQGDGSGSVYSV